MLQLRWGLWVSQEVQITQHRTLMQSGQALEGGKCIGLGKILQIGTCEIHQFDIRRKAL